MKLPEGAIIHQKHKNMITYKVMKSGIGIQYGHITNQVVKTGLSWQQAHVYVVLKRNNPNWRYWMMPE